MLEQEFFQHLTDGVVIMDKQRIIQEMNPAAVRLTGWNIGERAPYCIFCQKRVIQEGEQRCLLMGHNPPPYFESEMPTMYGETIPVSFSTTYLSGAPDEEGKTVLMLRDLSQKKKEDEIRMAKLLARQTIEAQEAERKRIALELHDGVGQSLFSVSMALQVLARQTDPSTAAFITDTLPVLQDAMQEVKRLSADLRPPALDMLGLNAALTSLIRRIEQHFPLAVTLHSNVDADTRFTPQLELNVYRIIQEALHNIAKHAHSPQAIVEVIHDRKKNRLTVTITDQGTGFDTEAVHHGGGLGLRHMTERTRLLDGTIRISSIPGRGTTIQISIPCTNKEALHADD